MTNPNNAVGTNAAYGGRTSVNAFNDDLTIYSRGILSGWACSPKSGMTVQIGGNGADRDAAVAEDNAGNKTSINNISGSPIDVTIPAAPATNNRIDLIVAYADNPPSGTSTVVDNPAACGIIVVSGTAAASPTAPTNATIRSAITADGASGSTAYYVILAQIRVGTGVTTIGSGVITQGDVVKSYAVVGTDSIADGAVTSGKIDWSTLAPTSTTSTSSSMTWYKRVFPDGTIVYSGYGSPSWWTGGNAWLLDITIPLPDGLTFHSSKMLASINLQPADAAVQAWGSVHSGSSSWSIGRANRYTGEITTTVFINATLVVFPN